MHGWICMVPHPNMYKFPKFYIYWDATCSISIGFAVSTLVGCWLLIPPPNPSNACASFDCSIVMLSQSTCWFVLSLWNFVAWVNCWIGNVLCGMWKLLLKLQISVSDCQFLCRFWGIWNNIQLFLECNIMNKHQLRGVLNYSSNKRIPTHEMNWASLLVYHLDCMACIWVLKLHFVMYTCMFLMMGFYDIVDILYQIGFRKLWTKLFH